VWALAQNAAVNRRAKSGRRRSSTVGALQIRDLKMGDQMSGPDIWSFIFRSCIFWSCIFSAPLYCTDLYVIRRTAIARNHGKRSNLSPKRRVAKVSCRQTACDWAPGRKRSHGNFIQLTVKWDGIILSCCIIFTAVPSVLWRCWLGGRKGIRPVKKLSCGGVAWLSVWSEVYGIWPSWCHCHSLSLASVKSRLVLPVWYRLT